MVTFDFEGPNINIDSVDPKPIAAHSVVGTPALSTSGLSTPPASDISVAPAAAATSPSFSVNADASDDCATRTRSGDTLNNDGQPSSTTAAIEKAVNEMEEVGVDGVLGGQGRGDNDDDYGMDMGSPFHSMFDLPQSPVLSAADLVPSRLNSPAPTETPAPTESLAPTSTSTITSLPTPPTLSAAAIIALAVATTALPESHSALLKRKVQDLPAVSNVDTSTSAKRPWWSVVAVSRNNALPVVATKTRKGKKSTSTPTTSAPAVGPSTLLHALSGDAPWLKSAIVMLTAGDLGDGWTNAINTWVLFECKEIDQAAMVLGSLHRPAAVRDWIQRACSAAYRPTIGSADSYATSYQLWWASLQPKWRLSASGEIAYEKAEGDWDVIRKPGKNGLLSVAAALFFWGLSVKDTDKAKGWETSVADLLFVLTKLLN